MHVCIYMSCTVSAVSSGPEERRRPGGGRAHQAEREDRDASLRQGAAARAESTSRSDRRMSNARAESVSRLVEGFCLKGAATRHRLPRVTNGRGRRVQSEQYL